MIVLRLWFASFLQIYRKIYDLVFANYTAYVQVNPWTLLMLYV